MSEEHLDELQPLITVIIPVYNVEKYIGECVDSIRRQDFQDFECIFVDDGSPDDSIAVALEAAKGDRRFRVVRHSHNVGLAGARNTGISEARGDYIAFVDSDDWVAPGYLSTLLNTLTSFDADISACGRYFAYENEGEINLVVDNAPAFANKRLTGAEALRAVNSYNSFDVSMCSKLFRKKCFEGITFPVGRNSEDYYVAPKLMLEASGVVYDTKPLYYYRNRSGSITNGSRINRDGLAAAKNQLAYIENSNMAEMRWVAVSAVALSCVGIANGYVQRGFHLKGEEITSFKEYCRKNLLTILKNPDLTLLKKAQVAALAASPRMYELAFNKLKRA